MGEGATAKPRIATCPAHDQIVADLDNLTMEVRNIESEQRAAAAWRARQEETTGRILGELSMNRRATEKAAEAAVKAVTLIEQLDKKWDRRHEELSGRVATLETRFEGNGLSHSTPEPVPSDLGDDLMSETTQTNLLAADKDGVFAAFLKEREKTSKLSADLAALQARFEERQTAQMSADKKQQHAAAMKLGWGKILVTAAVTLIVGLVGGAASCRALIDHEEQPKHAPSAQVEAPK